MQIDRSDKILSFADTVLRSVARSLLCIVVARLGGVCGYGVFMQLFVLDVVLSSAFMSAYVNPVVSIAPGMASPARENLYAWVLRRTVTLHRKMCLPALAIIAGLTVCGFDVVALVLCLASMFPSNIVHLRRAEMMCEFRSRRALAADVTWMVLTSAALAWSTTVALDPVASYWGANLLGMVAAVVAMGPRARNTGDPSIADRNRCRAMGRSMVVGSVANSACTRTQPHCLQVLNSVQQSGIFGAASTLIGPVRLIAVSLANVLRPRLALLHDQGSAALALLRPVVLGLAIATILGVVAGWAIGAAAVALVYGDGFGELAACLPVAVLYAGIEGLAGLSTVAVQVMLVDGARIATRLRLRACALTLLISVPACWMGGAVGAFLAMSVVEAFFVLGMVSAARLAWNRRPLRTLRGVPHQHEATSHRRGREIASPTDLAIR